MDTFDKAMDFVFKWEGGLCEDKNDAGGITKYGVCLRFLKSIKPDAKREDIIHMTQEQAKDIFYNEFWLRCNCDQIPEKIAFALFDTAINMGCKQAVKLLQRTIECKDDGIIGVVTINKCNDRVEEQDAVVDVFLKKRSQFYKDLASKKPSQQVFLNGWLNRTNNLFNTLLDQQYEKLA